MKLLPKRAPTNKVDREFASGAVHFDPKTDTYELHVTDGNRAAVIQLEHEEVPIEKGESQDLVSGQIPAPAIKFMQAGASIEDASAEQIVVWDDNDDAEVTFNRDAQLVSETSNVHHLIPVEDGDVEGQQICIDAKRLKEVAEAMACDKLILTIFGEGDPIRVDPIKGSHIGVIRQAERPRAERPEDEATESMLEDEVPPEDDPDKMLIED